MIAIVKVTQKCNLDCIYCFDRESTISSNMTLETVEEICKKDTHQEINIWDWFGGEATTMGVEWFRKAHKIIRSYYPNIRFSMQSNGTLLNEEWIEFFKLEKVDIGLSFDGLSQAQQRELSGKTLAGIKLLLKNNFNPGIISVISDDNYDKLLENYLYFKSLGINSLSFNKAFDSTRSIGIEIDQIDKYLKSFEQLFEYWLNDETAMDVQQFNGFLKSILETDHFICNLSGSCRGSIIGFNQLGQVEPCDRYFPEHYRTPLTIYNYNSLDEARSTEEYNHLSKQQKIRKETFCKDCEIFDYCHGGCPADALFFEDGTKHNENVCYIRKKEWEIIFNKIKDLKPENCKNKKAANLMFFNRDLNFINEIRRDIHGN